MTKIVVVGSGGVGYWAAVALARSVDPSSITIWDDDSLAGGLGHTRLPTAPLETKKVDLLRGFLMVSFGIMLPSSNLKFAKFSGEECDNETLVVDCCDSDIAPRREIWKKARERGARIIRVSYDGKNETVVVAEGLPLFNPVHNGYSGVPSLALSFAAGGIGATVVRRILEGKLPNYIEFQVSINELVGIPAKDAEVSVDIQSVN